MQATADTVVMLGTGGTIAGSGGDLGYRAATTPAAALLGDLAAPHAPLEVEQVLQIDSKDMRPPDWRRLIDAVDRHLARPAVQAIVVLHGTDTLEETAYLLQRVFAPAKPIVLTGAMRPAGSRQSDGPQNLADALRVAREPGARGVVAVLGGLVLGAFDVRKRHPYRLQAFDAGDAGPIGSIEAKRLRRFRGWPEGEAIGVGAVPGEATDWPVVEIVVSHAGARGAAVDALVAAGARGLVVATTGNGTVHADLEAALEAARRQGVAVLRTTRWLDGAIQDPEDAAPASPSAGALTPVQARIELMLRLAADDAGERARRQPPP